MVQIACIVATSMYLGDNYAQLSSYNSWSSLHSFLLTWKQWQRAVSLDFHQVCFVTAGTAAAELQTETPAATCIHYTVYVVIVQMQLLSLWLNLSLALTFSQASGVETQSNHNVFAWIYQHECFQYYYTVWSKNFPRFITATTLSTLVSTNFPRTKISAWMWEYINILYSHVVSGIEDVVTATSAAADAVTSYSAEIRKMNRLMKTSCVQVIAGRSPSCRLQWSQDTGVQQLTSPHPLCHLVVTALYRHHNVSFIGNLSKC